jgi:hypothetical protein
MKNPSKRAGIFCCKIYLLQKERSMFNRGRLVIECEEGRPRFVNGQEIPNWQQGPKILSAVQHLGGKGWELVRWDSLAIWQGHGRLTFRHYQSWDYLFMICEDGHPRSVNRQEIPNWQRGPSVLNAVKHLTLKGWELASNDSALKLGSGKLTFRRLKKMRHW